MNLVLTNLETETEAGVLVSDPIAGTVADSAALAFASLTQSAALEFHATIQLLAERARFLSGAPGVAIALEQDGQFVYTAAVGTMVPEIGTTADVTKYPLRKCVKTGDPVRLPIQAPNQGSNSPLAVAILKDDEVRGFFEVAPGAHPFEDADLEAVTRLADMISTALEHLEAAEQSATLISEVRTEAPAAPTAPVLWHAPETAASEPARAGNSHPAAPADIHACTACGFPVSGVRSLCVECDAPRDARTADPSPPVPELFTVGKEESWITAHGYTLASLLVSALAVAIIYWLR